MLGQLDWDGVVLPIADVSWSNLLATANRLQGLEVSEDFFVTYKDEEGDVINVKNEVDLSEAIRWAQEQGVPCLCLQVPFTAADSDSDESWTEIDNGSPRGVAHKEDIEDVDEAEKRSILHDDVAEDSASVLPPLDEQTTEEVPPENPIENEPESHVNTIDEDDISTVKDESVCLEGESAHLEESVGESMTEAPALETAVVEESEVGQCSSVLKALSPVTTVNEVEAIPAPVATQPTSGGAGIDKIIEIMCSMNDTNGDRAMDKEYFVEFFSNPANVDKILNFLSHPSVKVAISSIAQAEMASQGAAQKATTTQLIKVLYQNPEVLGHLNAIPELEEVLPRVLRGIKGELAPSPAPVVEESNQVPEEPKVVHSSVTCDGCADYVDLRVMATAKGLRNDEGQIHGVRYKSVVRPDFDLCESCESSGRFQTEAGPFLKIVDPETAPELIFCAMPGATNGMLSNLDSVDQSNTVARDFVEFVKSRQVREANQQRDQSTPPSVHVAGVGSATTPVVTEQPKVTITCKHLLKTFEAPHKGFTCDICSTNQAVRALLHGCRECNFDVCHACYLDKDLGLKLAPPMVAVPEPVTLLSIPPPPQAKFVSDVTLTDGCTVKAGEKLTKAWRVRNSGQERWPSGTRICHVGGDAFGGPMSGVEVPLAAPGEAVVVVVPLVMPQQPGRYTSYWRMVTPHPQNAKFGHRFWVTVNVVRASDSIAPVPAPAPTQATYRIPPPPPPIPSAPMMLPGSPAIRPPPPQAVAQPRYVNPSHFEETVARIADFGFTDIDKIVQVLGEVNGDAAAAIERLLEEA